MIWVRFSLIFRCRLYVLIESFVKVAPYCLTRERQGIVCRVIRVEFGSLILSSLGPSALHHFYGQGQLKPEAFVRICLASLER